MRGALIWLISTAVLLGALTAFIAAGWPGKPDSCTEASPDECFCEAFDIDDVRDHKPGVRQQANTWFNLYSVFTSVILVVFMAKDRETFKGRTAPNLMRSDSWIADIYLFAVLFLGLGSMWFHASITHWGGVVDGMSLYIYATFLVFYTAVRLCRRQYMFWIGYPTVVVTMTIFHALGTPSFALIIILVVLYLLLEIFVWIERGEMALGETCPIILWWSAAGCIIVATIFWALSNTDGKLCNPDSFAQPHALLWHPLAGAMAVLLYFYWRKEDARQGQI